MKKGKLFNLAIVFLLFGSVAMAQTIAVTGTVSGESGGLPGVSVLLEGSTQGTMSDVNGKYSINVPANGTLKFSFIGYLAQSVKVNNKSIINVSLVEEQTNLSEVVVTALGLGVDINEKEAAKYPIGTKSNWQVRKEDGTILRP
ncbi:CarboxypepD_reg-like domain-containing protein [Spirosomataceae bacterium TFI 002]|nr:CarboxypepD_reg-like domain-containing protein [Spirosomataceae bacterium TFI 002]